MIHLLFNFDDHWKYLYSITLKFQTNLQDLMNEINDIKIQLQIIITYDK